MSPVFQRFCLLLRGVASEDPGDSARHCELGFGQGVSVAIHAAANPGHYVGTDFNPAHAIHARSLASHAGADARLYDDSFAELLVRDDLPPLDSISLHGVWSWVNEDNRRMILDFARRRLKPGGRFFVSHNCLPGWAAAQPLRQVLALHDRYSPAPPGAAHRVAAALQFADALLAAGPAYARITPDLAIRLNGLKTQPANYVAHEYLNQAWHCAWFTDVADLLATAKLDFAATAQPLDVLDAINLTPEGIAFLRKIDHPILREQMRDYFVNRQFRKDIYLRGVRRLAPGELREQTLATRIVLLRPPDAIPMVLTGPQGEAALHEATFRPLLAALATPDYEPKSLSDIMPAISSLALADLLTACGVLVGAGYAAPCQPVVAVDQARARCAALNRYLLECARTRGDINVLASPATGGGVSVNRFEQLFLLAQRCGRDSPADWARFAWDCLAADGQVVLKDGQPLGSPEDNNAELTAQAVSFNTKRMPILRALAMV